MNACCQHHERDPGLADPRYRRVLWAVMSANAAMFVVELSAGLFARSVALQADALDFLGDALTYGISLAVLGMSLKRRASAAMLKGVTMGLFGFWVIGVTAQRALAGVVPDAPVMGVVGALALVVNLGAALALYRYRAGDANMRSVWLCTRNDAISNVAVMLAALGVWGASSGWPDLVVGGLMGGLALWSSVQVLGQARGELKSA